MNLRSGESTIMAVSNVKPDTDSIVTQVEVERLPSFFYFTKRARRHANHEALVAACTVEYDNTIFVHVNNVSPSQCIVSTEIPLDQFLKPQTHLDMREFLGKRF